MARWLVTWLAALSAVGCRPPETVPPTPTPLCHRASARNGADGVRAQAALDDADLLALVLAADHGAGADGSRDCTGAPIRLSPLPPSCAAAPLDAATPTDLPPSPERVLESGLEGARSAVWVETRRFADGTSLGPVALVERAQGAAEVLAIGALRTPTERLSFTSEEVGQHRLLVADAETCARPGDRSSCRRTASLLRREGTQLLRAVVMTGEGECVGPAELSLYRRESLRLASGWLRTFTLSASLDVEGAALVVREQVVVEESDPRSPGEPPRRVRVVDADRWLTVSGDTLTQDRPPLWDRVMELGGSLGGSETSDTSNTPSLQR